MTPLGKLAALLLSIYLITSSAAFKLPENYDGSTRPNQGGVADVVNVGVELLSIRSVNEEKSEMEIDISLHTSWVDARLQGIVARDILVVNEVPKIWMPNVQIANSASGSRLGATTSQVLHLNRDGVVTLSQKISPTVSCAISLAKYPFDRQTCELRLNSYGYNAIHIVLIWHGSVSADSVEMYHPEFSFSHTEQRALNVKTPNGEYSNLYLDISVTRCPLRVIFRAMLPSILLLILSYYVTFCHCTLLRSSKATANGGGGNHHVEASTVIAQPIMTSVFPAGFNLCLIAINGMVFVVTVFLAQINFVESPKSSAVSGLDVWLNFITAIVFVILWHSIQLYFKQIYTNPEMKSQSDSCFVDKTANILKIGIPPVFAVFIVVYFAVYLS